MHEDRYNDFSYTVSSTRDEWPERRPDQGDRRTQGQQSRDRRPREDRPRHARAQQRPPQRRQPQQRPAQQRPMQQRQPQGRPPQGRPPRGRRGNDPEPRSVGRIVLVALLAIIALIAVGAIVWVVTHADINPVESNTYDWSRLEQSYGRYRYVAEDGTASKLGIDVSHHNEDIDWAAVASDGIEFAYVRVGWRGYTDGTVQEDSYARANIEGARANGLDVGLYFFSQAITLDEAREEADFICDFADEYGIDKAYPLAFDMEENNIRNERIADLSIEEMTNIAIAFCDRVRERGYEPMIYGNDRWLDGYFNLERISKAAYLWLADYRGEPTEYYAFKMWQYASDGTVAGVEGGCDMDLLFPN